MSPAPAGQREQVQGCSASHGLAWNSQGITTPAPLPLPTHLPADAPGHRLTAPAGPSIVEHRAGMGQKMEGVLGWLKPSAVHGQQRGAPSCPALPCCSSGRLARQPLP